MGVKVVLPVSYLLVIFGSLGIIGFASRIPFSTRVADLSMVKQRIYAVDYRAGDPVI